MKRITVIAGIMMIAAANMGYAAGEAAFERSVEQLSAQVKESGNLPEPAKAEMVLTAQELALADCLTKVELVGIMHPDIAQYTLAEMKNQCRADNGGPVQYSKPTAQELALADCLTKVELVGIIQPDLAQDTLAEMKNQCRADNGGPVQYSKPTAQELALADCLTKLEFAGIIQPDLAQYTLAEMKNQCVTAKMGR